MKTHQKNPQYGCTNNIATFLNEAPDYIYLLMKVVLLIFGLNGACRGSELAHLTVDNVQKHSEVILVNLPDTETKRERSFVIKGEHKKIVERYQALRPSDYTKCVRQVIGKNKLSSIPGDIVLRIRADSGADLTLLKRHGGWKLSSIVEGYIEESVENKSKIRNKLTNNIKQDQASPMPGCSSDVNPRPASPLPGCSSDVNPRPAVSISRMLI